MPSRRGLHAKLASPSSTRRTFVLESWFNLLTSMASCPYDSLSLSLFLPEFGWTRLCSTTLLCLLVCVLMFLSDFEMKKLLLLVFL